MNIASREEVIRAWSEEKSKQYVKTFFLYFKPQLYEENWIEEFVEKLLLNRKTRQNLLEKIQNQTFFSQDSLLDSFLTTTASQERQINGIDEYGSNWNLENTHQNRSDLRVFLNNIPSRFKEKTIQEICQKIGGTFNWKWLSFNYRFPTSKAILWHANEKDTFEIYSRLQKECLFKENGIDIVISNYKKQSLRYNPIAVEMSEAR